MADTPTLRFLSRPSVPATGSDEYKRWAKEGTFAFKGGTLTATYGNLVQTISMNGLTDACKADPISVIRKEHVRKNKIGGPNTLVRATVMDLKRYPSKRSGNAAAGQPITMITDIGSYTARLTGDVQDFVLWLCGNGANFYGPISFATEHGTLFGPYSPITQN